MEPVPSNVVVDDLVELVELFTDVALGDGIAAPLLAVGAILVVFSMAVFGYLTLGALVDAVVPGS